MPHPLPARSTPLRRTGRRVDLPPAPPHIDWIEVEYGIVFPPASGFHGRVDYSHKGREVMRGKDQYRSYPVL